MSTISFLLLVLFWSQIHTFGADAVQIQLDPARGNALTTEAIQISCLQDSLDEDTQDVTLMELSRKGHEPLVHVSKCGQGNFGEDSSRFQVVANISKHPSQSYLNVSLINPESDDTGIYTCSLYYIDRSGHLKMETASENLLIENIDVKSLERVLNQMGDKITSLEMENKKSLARITSLGEKVTSLEMGNKKSLARITSLEMENKDLKEKVTYKSAFFATGPYLITSTKGQVLKFPLIKMMEGTGYNSHDGVFTSQRTGLYTFTLTVTMYHADQFISVSLKVNDQTMSQLFTVDEDYRDQSSISIMTRLEKGDTVKPVVVAKHSDGRVWGHPFSYFSGYLIQPL